MNRWLKYIVMGTLPITGPVLADERALQQALAKAQFMLKQASAEKVAAEQELAALKEDFAQYRKKAEHDLQTKEQGAVRLAGNVSTMKERYMELADRFQQVQIAHGNALKTAREVEQKLDKEQQKFKICYDNNKKMYEINQEILGNYEDKGVWEVIREKEPFTGFAAVKMEEFIQDYQYQNEDLKIEDALLGSASIDKK